MSIATYKLHFQELYADPFFIWSGAVTIVCSLLTLLITAVSWNRLPPVVPFFYSLPWGEEQLAPNYSLFLLTTSGFLLLIFNSFIALLIKPLSKFFARTLLVAAAIAVVLLSITVINVILLMT